MGELKDKISGSANIGGGRIRQGLAQDLGDSDMAAQGSGQEMKGRMQRRIGQFKGMVGGMLQRLGGKARRS